MLLYFQTAFLETVLSELVILEGKIRIQGKLSYASQKPWFLNGTIRENIIFGSEFKNARYQNVLEICELKKDLNALPNNDLTNVGEHGVSLSGGQKSRISLARALYRDADIYLLDDIFASVDERVASSIFQNGLKDFLKDKLVLLVTHRPAILLQANKIISIDKVCANKLLLGNRRNYFLMYNERNYLLQETATLNTNLEALNIINNRKKEQRLVRSKFRNPGKEYPNNPEGDGDILRSDNSIKAKIFGEKTV